MILHPRAAAPELLRFYRDFMADAPDEVCGGFALLTAPPADFIPEPARGKPVAGLIVLYAGDPDEGEQVLRPLVEWGDPWLAQVQPMPYAAVQAMTDDANPWGISEYFKIDYLPDLPDAAIDALVETAAHARSPLSAVYVCALGGALARTDRTTMALEVPDAKWFYFCEALWSDADDGARRDRLGARVHGHHAPVGPRQGARELHQRRRSGHAAARLLRRRQVRAPDRPQGRLRPRQRLRAQPKHPADRVPTRGDGMTIAALDPAHLMQIATGFAASKTILSAVELDLFTHLGADSITGEELSNALGLHPRATYDFLDMLVALHVLERDGDGPDGRYRNTAESAAFLDTRSPAYIGGVLEICNARLYRFWGDLTEALQTGKPQNEIKHTGNPMFEELYRDPARLEQFMRAMQGSSLGNFHALAETFDFSPHETVCDVGGATGTALHDPRHPTPAPALHDVRPPRGRTDRPTDGHRRRRRRSRHRRVGRLLRRPTPPR